MQVWQISREPAGNKAVLICFVVLLFIVSTTRIIFEVNCEKDKVINVYRQIIIGKIYVSLLGAQFCLFKKKELKVVHIKHKKIKSILLITIEYRDNVITNE